MLDGLGAGGEQGPAAGAEREVVGAADGGGPPVVVGVRGAGDPGVSGAGGNDYGVYQQVRDFIA